ncbi:MAG TPA: HEPN domain-containing protein [Sedimentisphaerales bacterium]|jgi:HEPN domain-containing protein|nr:HEPN domain-containing protein [Sedimentisphaerales bacterium]HNU29800.1 HEPN domain-containing protein [Sedimentisphaerales bacterium]
MKEITEHWLHAAHDDLRVTERIASDESLTHMVAFHAQQCIEKSLKAIVEEHQLGHIRIHNLARLLEIVRPILAIDAEAILIEKLDKLYIDARYPAELGLLPNGRPTLTDARQFYALAQSTYATAKAHLEAVPPEATGLAR